MNKPKVQLESLESYLNSCYKCGAKNADNIVCNACFASIKEFGGEAPTIENKGLGSGVVKACTRPLPHVCAVNGPCNGWPKQVWERQEACPECDGDGCNNCR